MTGSQVGAGAEAGTAGAGGAAARPVRVQLTRAEAALPSALSPPPPRLVNEGGRKWRVGGLAGRCSQTYVCSSHRYDG